MSELSEKMNWMLSEIDKEMWISLSKDDSELTFKAKDKLRAYGLIEPQGKYSWRLTQEGYDAVELGGFEEWLKSRKNKENTGIAEQFIKGKNISIVTGDKNTINQNSEKSAFSKKESLTKKIVVGIIISVSAGVILSFILDYINRDSVNNDSKDIKLNYTEPPISLTFANGATGILFYSANLELIDSLLIKTGSTFGEPEKAINYLKERIRNELVVTLEKAELDSVRIHRKEIANEIVRFTEVRSKI